MKTKGFDEFKNKLKQLQNNAQSISGENKVPLPELMPDSFVRKYTNFQTLQEMIDASGIEQSEEMHGEAFSEFIATQTRFSDWNEMTKAAGAEWMRRKLEL
jgi:hypothetical protein